jgi:STE24 endopeptidase
VSGAYTACVWVVLEGLLLAVRPLTRVQVIERLAGLAERARVGVPRVDEYVVGETTRRAHATLVGLGPTRRILLSDTLLAHYSDDEIEVVVAHELGITFIGTCGR